MPLDTWNYVFGNLRPKFDSSQTPHDTVLDYADLFSVTHHEDYVQEFETRWDEVLLSMSKIPSDDILDSLYKLRIRESEQIKTELGMVRRSVDQELRLRNFDARHGKIETGAVVKSRKGLIGVEGGKGICFFSVKKKASVRRETNAVSGMRVTIVRKKTEHNAATPSEPSVSRGRSVSRKRSIRGKGHHGAFLRQPCRYYFMGTCTRTSCEYWHPPECQIYKNETGCKAGQG